MRKSKVIFGIIAGCVIAICLFCFIFLRPKTTEPVNTPTEPQVSGSIETDPVIDVTIPEDIPQEPINLDIPQPPVEIGENVRIEQVDRDPSEVIYRQPVLDPTHPEFLEGEESSPLLSSEGSVYRNDKVISIDIVDQQNGDICTFSFGHITGQCNRFLYLNPQFELNGEKISNNIFFKFDEPYGGGIVETYGMDTKLHQEQKKCLNYSFYRSFEERQVCGYLDAKHPGTFWFTQSPIEENVYVDVKAYYYQGGMFATLRLTIAKAEDGTYSIVDIDSKDMLTNGDNEVYSKQELAYIVELTDQTYHTPGMVHAYNSLQMEWVLNVEDCIIELRDSTTGLYFNQFIPHEGSDLCSVYAEAEIPILAVTYRWKGVVAQTMYFWVIREPDATTHGIYQFIGYDYPLLQEIIYLEGYGYSGNG